MPTTENTQEQLLAALDLEGLPPEEQERLLLDLNSLIFRGSLLRLIEAMEEPARAEFAALMDSGADEGAIEAFLAARGPSADEAVRETIQDLTDDILSVSTPN